MDCLYLRNCYFDSWSEKWHHVQYWRPGGTPLKGHLVWGEENNYTSSTVDSTVHLQQSSGNEFERKWRPDPCNSNNWVFLPGAF